MMKIPVMLSAMLLALCIMINPASATVNASITEIDTNIGLPVTMGLDREFTVIVYVDNIGDEDKEFYVGLDIGNETEGYCNKYCYVNPVTLNNKTYGAKELIAASDHARVEVPFMLKSDVILHTFDAQGHAVSTGEKFKSGESYDLGAGVWNCSDYFAGCQLDVVWKYNNITIFPTPTVADITLLNFNPTSVYPYRDVVVSFKVENLLLETRDYWIGLSIGKDAVVSGGEFRWFDEYWCDKACYVDGLGDFLKVTLDPYEEKIYSRTLRINPESFSPGGQTADSLANDVLDAAVTVREAVPNGEIYDLDVLYDGMTVLPMVIFAHPVQIGIDKTQIKQNEIITVRSWVLNNGTHAYNFTLGMSIGSWNAVDRQVYTTWQPTIVYPCNTVCYVDGLGSWVYYYLPPGETAYFTRRLKVPEYFPVGSKFDVAVAVWTGPNPEPDGSDTLISAVYWKNVSTVTGTVTPTEDIVAGYIGSGTKWTEDVFEMSMGWTKSTTRFVIWCLFALLFSIAALKYGGDSATTLAVIGSVTILLTGVPAGFVPWWVGVVIIVITSVLFARYWGSLIGGD